MRFLLFLDAHPACYWGLVGTLLALTVASALAPGLRAPCHPGVGEPQASHRASRAAFFALVALTLFAGRWPGLFFPMAYNVDEDMLLAQAITAAREPLPWESFDGQTNGPLDTLALAWPAWLGGRLDYVTARGVGLLEIFGGLAALFAVLRRAFDEAVGRVALVPVLAFYALTDFNDFMHHTTEHTPVLLVMWAFALGATLGWCPGDRLATRAAWTGGALALIPFAKLQAVPEALAVALVAGTFVLARTDLTRQARVRALLALALGGLGWLLVLGCFLAWRGVFGDFVTSYLTMQIRYIGQADPTALAALWERVPDFWAYFLPAAGWTLAAALGATLAGCWRKAGRMDSLLAAGAAAALAASFFAIYQPHRPYGHYLLLAVFPAGCLAGTMLGVLLKGGLGTRPKFWWLAVGLFLTVSLLPLVRLRVSTGNRWLGQLSARSGATADAVIGRLRQWVRPGERMAVWGWRPELFVRTGARLGTRDSHAEQQIKAGALQSYYRARFLKDLETKRPAFFVDAVAPGAAAFTDRAAQGFETFPELARYVAGHYDLLEDIGGVRIYRVRARQEDPARG